MHQNYQQLNKRAGVINWTNNGPIFGHNTTFWDMDSFNSLDLQHNTGVQENGMNHLLFEC